MLVGSFVKRDTTLNPVIIVEVLSESTRNYDRGRKFQHYRKLPSLTEPCWLSRTSPAWNTGLVREKITGTLSSSMTWCRLFSSRRSAALPLTEIYDKLDFGASDV